MSLYTAPMFSARCCRMAGNFPPLTPTIPSWSTCDKARLRILAYFEVYIATYFSQSPQVEESQTDNLQILFNKAAQATRWCNIYPNLNPTTIGTTNKSLMFRALAFLSDLDAPDPVHPVVYSPCKGDWTSADTLRLSTTHSTAWNHRIS